MTDFIIILAAAFSIGFAGTAPRSNSLQPNDPERLSAAAGESSALLTSTKIEFEWTGSGFLCLKKGKDCKVTLGIGLHVSASPQEYNMPIGSNVGLLEAVDGAPVPQGAPLSVGEHDIDYGSIRVVEGDPLPPGTTIYIPEQETVYDPAHGQLIYYFGG